MMVIPRRAFAALLACAVVLLSPRAIFAAEQPGARIRISLLTMSPGDPTFTKFGHDALLVEDFRTGRALVYNFGTFVFDSPWLAIDFLRGNLRYWLSVSPLESVIRHYEAEGRSITVQQLRIAPKERARIASFLALTERSPARFYKYDYYRDNCATRVRDIVDRATGGRLRAASSGPGPMTYRDETLRLTAGDPMLSLGLDFAMGPSIDRPLTLWGSEFLPARLESAVRRVRVPGPAGDEPLVASERVLVPAPGRDTRASPPRLWPPLLLAGLTLGALFSTLGLRAGGGNRAERVILAVLIALFGFVSGALGCVVAAFAAFTDHSVTYYNHNLLLATPWSVALIAFAPRIARADALSITRARVLAALSLATSVAALVIAPIPSLGQKNLAFVGLFLPAWLGASLSLSLLLPARERNREEGSAVSSEA